MSRTLTAASTLENLKREAKRWLKALRAGDSEARLRLARALSDPPTEPTLRDVQLALAREHGFAGWTDLRREVEAIARHGDADPRRRAIRELYDAAERGDAARAASPSASGTRSSTMSGDASSSSATRAALHRGIHHRDVVRVLLERGANPNLRDVRDPVTGDGDDALPLHFAAELSLIHI